MCNMAEALGSLCRRKFVLENIKSANSILTQQNCGVLKKVLF